jgi:hypothetical protein
MKVNVTFEAVGGLKDKLTKSPKDTIAKISRPFLEWPNATKSPADPGHSRAFRYARPDAPRRVNQARAEPARISLW